jgi:hypothetical protein
LSKNEWHRGVRAVVENAKLTRVATYRGAKKIQNFNEDRPKALSTATAQTQNPQHATRERQRLLKTHSSKRRISHLPTKPRLVLFTRKRILRSLNPAP